MVFLTPDREKPQADSEGRRVSAGPLIHYTRSISYPPIFIQGGVSPEMLAQLPALDAKVAKLEQQELQA